MEEHNRVLFLRSFDLATDLPHVMDWVNDEEITFYFASMQDTIKYDEEKKFMQALLQSNTDRVYSIYDQNNVYIGQASINKIDWIAKTGRLFLVFKKEFHGKGLAKQAIREAQRKAFMELNLNKIWLITRYKNEKDRHLYKRCGFETEGILREEYLVNGAYHDMARMSMLAREFKAWWKE